MTDPDALDAFRWLTAEEVRRYHDAVLEPGNLTGEDGTRPVEAALSRVEQRAHYGDLSLDVLAIGVGYLVAIAKAHAFRDGNKRTALIAFEMFLDRHGYQIVGDDDLDPEWLAKLIENVAGSAIDEAGLHDALAPYFVETDD